MDSEPYTLFLLTRSIFNGCEKETKTPQLFSWTNILGKFDHARDIGFLINMGYGEKQLFIVEIGEALR